MNTISTIPYQHNFHNTICVPPLVNEICDETMPPYEFNDNINTLCIKATLGLGKTNTLYDFLRKTLLKKYKSCLIITFRVSLCEKYVQDLMSFTSYQDIEESYIDSEVNPFVIIQLDSLKRIRGNYDLIILDEVTYSLTHLVTSVESKKRCYDILEQILYEDNHIITMDALFDNDWLQYLNSYGRRIEYINNTFSIHKNKKIINFKNNTTALYDKIRESIKNKENIVIASNSKSELKHINNLIENYHTGTKKLFIMKETKNKLDLNQWNYVQVLAYSPSIVAGVSYTEKHYNRFFGIFCNTSATADMALQQMFRVRDISSNEYNICCTITGKNDYPENDENIRKLILQEDKCLINGLDNVTINYIKKDIIEDGYFRLYSLIQKKKFKSCNDFINVLINYLKLQGIENIEEKNGFDINNKKLYNKHKKELKISIQEEEAKRIENAYDFTEDIIEEIEKKKNKTDDEIYILKKNKLKRYWKITSDKITKEIIMKYKNSNKQLYNNARVYCYGNNFYEKIIKRLEYNEKKSDMEDNTVRLGRDKTIDKIYMGIHMLKYFGFENNFDTKHINIDKNKFKNYILKYHNIIESLFKCNNFDIKMFDDKKWYQKCKMYINSKLNSLFKIRIIEDKKTKLQYIKGMEFWDENTVTYKNPLILNDLIEKEKEYYDKIDKDFEDYKIMNLMSDYINSDKTYEEIFGESEIDPLTYYDNCNNYL